jgi:hypothetical protein
MQIDADALLDKRDGGDSARPTSTNMACICSS